MFNSLTLIEISTTNFFLESGFMAGEKTHPMPFSLKDRERWRREF